MKSITVTIPNGATNSGFSSIPEASRYDDDRYVLGAIKTPSTIAISSITVRITDADGNVYSVNDIASGSVYSINLGADAIISLPEDVFDVIEAESIELVANTATSNQLDFELIFTQKEQ